MTLDDALRELAAGSPSQEAGKTLHSELQRLSKSGGVIAAHREEALDRVLDKLLRMAREPGAFEEVRSATGLVRTMLKNASIDVYRREERRRKAEQGARAPTAPDAPPPPSVDEERLTELFAMTLKRRTPRYRPFLQRSWEDLLAVLAGASLPEVLVARGVEPTTVNLNAAYKGQERLREAMLDLIEYKRTVGRWTDEDAEVYRAEVQLLIRCQGRGSASVSRGRSPS